MLKKILLSRSLALLLALVLGASSALAVIDQILSEAHRTSTGVIYFGSQAAPYIIAQPGSCPTGQYATSISGATGLPVCATLPTGTAGHTLPYLDGNNTYSGANTHSGAETFSGAVALNGATTAGTPAASDNSNAVQTYAGVNAKIAVVAGKQLLAPLSCATTSNCNLTGGVMQDTTHLTSTYSEYDVIVSGCLTNANANLGMQVLVSGAWKTAGYDGTATVARSSSVAGTTFSTYIPIIWSHVSSTVEATATGHFSRPTNAKITTYLGSSSIWTAAPVSDTKTDTGAYLTAGAISGIRFGEATNAGLMNACTVKLYGSN